MKNINNKSGFTAIELLVTLFIAAAFLVSGYQLYSLIIKDGGQTRSQSSASNLLYNYLQRYKGSATSPCTAQTPLTNAVPNPMPSNLVSVTVTVVISCPYGTSSPVSKVLATVNYNNPQQSLSNATFVKYPNIVTDGLLLNFDAGNTTSYPGSGTSLFDLSGNDKTGVLVNGVGYNASNGGSLSFDGVSQHRVLITPLSFGITNSFTAEVWMSSQDVTLDQTIMSKNGPFFLYLGASSFKVGIYASGSWAWATGTITLVNNKWYDLVLTYDGSSMKSYVNGVLDTTTAKTGNMGGMSAVNLGYPTAAGVQYNMKGLISISRMYNQVLSPLEVQQNFNAIRDRYGV